MKRSLNWMVLSTLMVCVGAQSAFAQKKKNEMVTLNYSQQHDARGLNQLNFNGFKGMKVTISTHEANEIAYTVTIVANEEAMIYDFGSGEVKFDRVAETGTLSLTELSRQSSGNNEPNWIKALLTGKARSNTSINSTIKEARIEIKVPASLALKLSTRYAEYHLNGIQNNVTIHNRSGKIALNGIKGEMNITNDFGDISVTDSQGTLTIKSRSSTISLTNVTGDVSMNVDYGKMNLELINGSVQSQNRSGSLVGNQIMGNVQHKGDFTSVKLNQVKGEVFIESRSAKMEVYRAEGITQKGDFCDLIARDIGAKGVNYTGRSANVKLEDVEGDVTTTGDYVGVRAQNVQGKTNINGRSASIDLSNLKQETNIHGDFMKVNLDDFSGDKLHITGRSSPIMVRAVGNSQDIQIITSSAEVQIALTKGFKGSVNLSSTNGTIKTEVDGLTIQEQTSQGVDQQLIGTIGVGGSGVVLVKTTGNTLRISN